MPAQRCQAESYIPRPELLKHVRSMGAAFGHERTPNARSEVDAQGLNLHRPRN